MNSQRGPAMWRVSPVLAAALRALLGAGALLTAVGGAASAAPLRPVAGQQVHFPQGSSHQGPWSAVPQIGPNGKVRQCVLVAMRSRAITGGVAETRFSADISAGSGLAFAVLDDQLPADDILDDQAELIIDGRTFPAVAFTVANSHSIAVHPGDAAATLAALKTAAKLRLRSDGAGVDTGDMALEMPADALGWLVQCGKSFNIAVDRPTDPDAPPLPVAQPRSPAIAPAIATPAGPPGIEIKWKIARWDASELRDNDGRILVCMIRQHYSEPQGSGPVVKLHVVGTFLMASRAKGLTMMVKDSNIDVPGEAPVDATLVVGGKPFSGYEAHALGSDEIGIFPQHGMALGTALGDGSEVDFNAPKVERMQFSIPAGVVPWLRACARRNGFGFEPAASSN